MANPVYQGTGGIGAGTDFSVAVPYPTTVNADDILIACIMDADNDSFDSPIGWVKIAEQTTIANLSYAIYWKRADGTETGSVTFTSLLNSGSLVAGIIYRYSGCVKVGVPFELSYTYLNTNTSFAITYNGRIPLGAERLAVGYFIIEDNTIISFTPVGGATEDSRLATTVGSDAHFSACSEPTSVQAGYPSVTTSATEYGATCSFYLIPESDIIVTPNTTDLTVFDTGTPTLEFTGDDVAGDDIEYEIQISPTGFEASLGLIFLTGGSFASIGTGVDSKGQSFISNGGPITSVKFLVKAIGSPTGNVYAKLYAHSGTYGVDSVGTGSVLATSNVLDSSILPSIESIYEFTFPTPYNPVANEKYVIVIEHINGTNTNCVSIKQDSSKHDGNQCFYNGSSWANIATNDLSFEVISVDEYLIQALSETPDAGFLNTINGGDLHSFNDNEKISYTVQAADELPDNTYYWRARAIDPLGINVWSDWTTIRSFDVTGLNAIPQETNHTHTADNVVLTSLGVIALSVAEASHSHTVDNITLSIVTNLLLQSSTHSHSADAVVVVPKYNLIVAEALHTHLVDSVIVVPKYNLVTSDTIHSQTTDNVSLSVSYIVTINDSIHSHLTDSIIVVAKFSLVSQDSTHLQPTENVVLEAGIMLVPVDTIHAHLSDNIVITNLGLISIISVDSTHSHLVNNLDLIKNFTLVVQESTHVHSTDNVVVTNKYTLAPNETNHSHSSDTIGITEIGLIALVSIDSLHSHLTDNLDIVQKRLLIVDDSIHTVFSDLIVTTIPISAILLVEFPFNADKQGWVLTSDGKSTGVWQSTGGNLLGCWYFDSLGRNNTSTTFIELTTTWEALGIAPGSVVTSITLPKVDWRISFVNVSNGGDIGPFELLDNIDVIQGTFFAAESFIGITTSWVTKNGITVAVPSGIQASGSTIKFKLSCVLDNGNNSTAETSMLLDNVDFTINYDGGATNLTLPVVGGSHAHTSDNVILEISVGNILVIAESLHSHNSDNTVLLPVYNLVVHDSIHTNLADNTVIAPKNTLVANDSLHTNLADNTVVVPKYDLILNESLHDHLGDSVILTNKYNLIVEETLHSHLADNVILANKYSLVATDGLHTVSSDSSILTVGLITLTIQESLHAQSTDGIDLQEGNVAVVQESSHSHIVESVIVVANLITLVVQESTNNHLVDAVVLTNKYQLIVTDGNHSLSSDSVVLVDKYQLVVNDSYHSLSSNNISLGTNDSLSINDANHIHTADSPVLTNKYQLIINDSNHSLSSDNVVVIYNLDLIVLDSLHNQSTDGIDLQEGNVAVVQETLHNHFTDNVIITVKYDLVVSDSLHSQSTDGIDLQEGNVAVVQEASHLHNVDSVVLISKYNLSIDDSLHTISSDSPALAFNLIVQETLHNHISDSPILAIKYDLVCANSIHSHSADSPILVPAVVALSVPDTIYNHLADSPILGVSLIVAENLHNNSPENPAIIGKYSLSVADSTHSHTTENVIISKLLVVSDSNHAHSTDAIILERGYTLIVNNADSQHSADNIVVSGKYDLVVFSGNHLPGSDNVDLQEGNVLSLVNDSVHLHSVDEANLIDIFLSEKIVFNSTITEEIRFESLVTEKIVFNSTITEEIRFESLVTEKIRFESLVTERIEFNSKIL